MHMKTTFTVLLLGLITLLLSFTSVIADALEERSVYLSATEFDYPPFSVTDRGEADGFSVDLLKAVAAEMGIVVTFKVDQWSTIKDELANGEIDILPLVGYTSERDELFDFTVPYIVMRGNIFVRKGETLIQTQDDLFGKEVLVLEGDNSQEWAWSIGLDEELTATATYTEAFELLASGQFDAVLAQGLVGEKIISDSGLDNIEPVYIYENDGVTKRKLNLEGYEQKFCFAVVEGDSELLSILNEGLVLVSANGTYDELFHEWFPFYVVKDPLSTMDIIKYIAVFLIPIIVLLLGGYSYIVSKRVKVKTSQIEKNNFRNKIIANAFQNEFASTTKRYDYILSELITLTESQVGFIFSIDALSNIDIKSCSSKLTDEHCNHNELIDVIKKSIRIQEAIFLKESIVCNEYNEEYPNHPLHICGQDVTRLVSLAIPRNDITNVIVLANKKRAYSEFNVVQTKILMNGLWTMLEREEQNDKVEYLSFHDSLTGLYNRRFFEEEMNRLDNPRNYPITIAMGDINGLKLVNDAFGHKAGDQLLTNIGTLLKKHCRANDIAARWGGDEFTLLLPNTTADRAEVLINRIQEKIKNVFFEYGKISISFGVDCKHIEEEDIRKIFTSAEELMYQNKLAEIDSIRGETIHTIMTTLFEKSAEVKEHSERVSKLSVMIAEEMGLTKANINDIKTMGMLHDIGKIVIDLHILDKPGKLTIEEREIIQKHPLSGSKMLNSSHEYTRLAAGVLHHHERIDGKGYPNGIIGEQIPLESKIIAVADAFDAMTAQRPYRLTPLSIKEAIDELKKHSGTQFDDKIVEVFVNQVLKQHKSSIR